MPSRITLAVTASCRRWRCRGGGDETKVTPLLRWVRGGGDMLGRGRKRGRYTPLLTATTRFTRGFECDVWAAYNSRVRLSLLHTRDGRGRVGKKRKNPGTRRLSRAEWERGRKTCLRVWWSRAFYTAVVCAKRTVKKRGRTEEKIVANEQREPANRWSSLRR